MKQSHIKKLLWSLVMLLAYAGDGYAMDSEDEYTEGEYRENVENAAHLATPGDQRKKQKTGLTPGVEGFSLLGSPPTQMSRQSSKEPNSGEKRNARTAKIIDDHTAPAKTAIGSAQKKSKKEGLLFESPMRTAELKLSISPEFTGNSKPRIRGRQHTTTARSHDLLSPKPNHSGYSENRTRNSHSFTSEEEIYNGLPYDLTGSSLYPLAPSPYKPLKASSSKNSLSTSSADESFEEVDHKTAISYAVWTLSECVRNEQDAYVSLLLYIKTDPSFVDSILQLERIGIDDLSWGSIAREVRKNNTSDIQFRRDDIVQKLIDLSSQHRASTASNTVMQFSKRQERALGILFEKIPAGCKATALEVFSLEISQKLRGQKHHATGDLITSWHTELDRSGIFNPATSISPVDNYTFALPAATVSQIVEFALEFLTPRTGQEIYYVQRNREKGFCLNLKECYEEDGVNKERILKTVRFTLKPKSTGSEGSFSTHPQVGLWVANFEYQDPTDTAHNAHLVVYDTSDFTAAIDRLQEKITGLNAPHKDSFIRQTRTEKYNPTTIYTDAIDKNLTKTLNFITSIRELISRYIDCGKKNEQINVCVAILSEFWVAAQAQHQELLTQYQTMSSTEIVDEQAEITKESEELLSSCSTETIKYAYLSLNAFFQPKSKQKEKLLHLLSETKKYIAHLSVENRKALEEIEAILTSSEDTTILRGLTPQLRKLHDTAESKAEKSIRTASSAKASAKKTSPDVESEATEIDCSAGGGYDWDRYSKKSSQPSHRVKCTCKSTSVKYCPGCKPPDDL